MLVLDHCEIPECHWHFPSFQASIACREGPFTATVAAPAPKKKMTNDRRRMRNRGDHYDIACFPPDRTTPAPGSWTEAAALFPYDQVVDID